MQREQTAQHPIRVALTGSIVQEKKRYFLSNGERRLEIKGIAAGKVIDPSHTFCLRGELLIDAAGEVMLVI